MNKIKFQIALLTMLLFFNFAKAQVKTYTQTMDSLLASVDKTQMKTDILYDRVMPFANLIKVRDTTDFEYFRQAHSELYRAAYKSSFKGNEFPYSKLNENDKELNVVSLGLIDASFDYLNEKNIETKKDLSVISSTDNLFLQQQATFIAPLKKWVASTSKVIYTLPSEYILLKNGRKIKHLEANFDNSQSIAWIEDSKKLIENIEINYKESGHKFVQFKITFDDGISYTQTTKVDVRLYRETSRLNSYPLEEDFIGHDGITATMPFVGYNEPSGIRQRFGTLEYRTYYNLRDNNGTRESKMRKTVIVLDGFDPGDDRKIYPLSIGYNNEIANNSIYELMNFIGSNGRQNNIVDLLRSPAYGYDVILVNFPKGADYVERNAMAVVELLSRINGELQANGSSEEVVLIGPSMGGLISRYALSYMEANNMRHNTRLWISFDSPHLGANIPLAAQAKLYFFGMIGGQAAARDKFNENFRSPAARQMLVEQLDYIHESPHDFFNGIPSYATDLFRDRQMEGQNSNSPFRIRFMDALNNNGVRGSGGFPLLLRKVALINGTTLGTKVGGAEGDSFLELVARTYLRAEIIRTYCRFLEVPFVENEVFRARFNTAIGNGIRRNLNRTNINPRGSMDIVQGGTYNTAAILKDEFTEILEDNSSVRSYEWNRFIPTHSFIPSVSSLAFYDSNFDWNSLINRNLVCSREIPFDSYFSPPTNEDHVQVTASSVEWLLQEIEGNPQAPSYSFNNDDFTFSNGSSSLCVGDAAILRAEGDRCKYPSRASWSVSPNLQIINQNDFSVHVQAISNGDSFIKATFEGGAQYTKSFWVGNLELDYNIECAHTNDCNIMCKSNYLSLDNTISINTIGNNNNQVLEWEWEQITTNFNLYPRGNSAYFLTPQSGFIAFRVRAKNACGWSDWLFKQLPVEECSSIDFPYRTGKLFQIYPNPTSRVINIELIDSQNKSIINKTEIGIYNLMGQLKKTLKLTDFKGQIHVNDLPKGLYILKINIDGQLETHQVQID